MGWKGVNCFYPDYFCNVWVFYNKNVFICQFCGFFNDNLRTREMNEMILPVAGSGGFSRLPSVGTAPRCSSLPLRTGPGLAGAIVDPHVTWRKHPSCSSAQAAGQTWQMLAACCHQSPPLGYPAQPLLAAVCPALYISGLDCMAASPASAPIARLHAALPRGT